MQAFRLSIRLCAPMLVPRHPIHLDAVLAALRVRQAEDSDATDSWACADDLPLERYVSPSGQWVFKAGILRGALRSDAWLEMMTSRSNIARVAEDRECGLIALRAAKINPAGGPFKASVFNRTAAWISTLTADGVGDPEAVRALLADLRFVGGRRSVAMGRVAAYDVTVIEEEAKWQDRVMPDDTPFSLPGPVALVRSPLHAPYWRKSAAVNALLPVDF